MLVPLGKRVMVHKPVAPTENKTASGIYVSPQAPEADNESVVVAVGDDVTLVKVGDKVVYPRYGYTEISEDDRDYYIIDESDLIARYKK